MATRCEVRISEQERLIEIEAPSNRILPGRMIRNIIRNLETRYKVCEYFPIRSEKSMDGLEDVADTIPLYPSSLNKDRLVVLQSPHPSMYDPNFVQLNQEQLDEISQTLEPGEELTKEDYTVAMNTDCFLLVTDDLTKFATVAGHLRLADFGRMVDCADRLGCANITVQDEAVITIHYNEENTDILELVLKDCDEFMHTPVYQKMVDLQPGQN